MTPTPEERFLALLARLRVLAFEREPLPLPGITRPQFAFLNWVAEAPGRTLRDIAAGLNVSPPTATVMVHLLSRRRHLRTERDPVDRRNLRVYLTKEGEELVGEVRKRRLVRARRFLSALSAEQQSELLALLESAISASERQLMSE